MARIKIHVVASTLCLGLAIAGAGTCLAFRGEGRNHAGKAIVEEQKVEPPTTQSPTPKAKQEPADPMTSYPFRLDPVEVLEFPELIIDYHDFHLKTGPVTVAPITTDPGITGVMIIGNGSFRFVTEKDKSIEGQSRALMLRFNPGEQPSIIPLAKGKRVSDRGLAEMSRHLLQVVIRHCYQSSMDGGRRQEVLIPPQGAFAADLYTKEYGDLLISFDDKRATVHNFTERRSVFEKK